MDVVAPQDLLNRLLAMSWQQVRTMVWVYRLDNLHSQAPYVGTTTNPICRFTEHFRNSTKDTAGKLSSNARMTLLDLVDPSDRYAAEARYIASQGASNTNRLEALLPKAKTLEEVLERTLRKAGLS